MTPPGAAAELPLADVERILERACGIALSSGIRRTLADGVGKAARELGLEVGAFVARLLANESAAVTALVESAVVGETYFFRHPEQIEAARVLALEPAPKDRPLAIWSAGCATGEEPYTLAMALLDAGRAGCADRVLATDVSERALESARRGVYGEWSLRRLDPAIRARHFDPDAAGRLVVRSAVRERVEFRRCNLISDPVPATGFDVVFCRNVLIYFTAETAAAVAARALEAVRPGGLLVVGPVEVPFTAGLPVERIERDGATVFRRLAPGESRAAVPPAARRRAVGLDARHRRHRERAAPPRATDVAARPPAPALAAQVAPPARTSGAAGFEAAREAARRGELEVAERIAAEVATRELCPESFLLLAMAAEARGDFAGAVEAVRRALYLDPGLAMAHATLVPLYGRLGREEEAARARRNALSAIEGLEDGAVLRGVEAITAGALRTALGAAGRDAGGRASVLPGSLR
ncbi:MAG TPA: protein-glutamate O-methyltransferase CheR [Anaeromyxobacteraceae bacterium]|nr:protein-glutamate O-methyltransferase CheR [Anaeromyxobacteraceae bacterium]